MLRILTCFLPLTLAAFGYCANGEATDRQFVAQFQNYRTQHRVTTLQAIRLFAAYKKVKPEVLLKRLIATQWDMGGAEKQKALMSGVEAFEQSGLTHEQALQKISDMVGQLTETLEYMYKQGKATSQQAAAKPAPLPARGVAVANYKQRH